MSGGTTKSPRWDSVDWFDLIELHRRAKEKRLKKDAGRARWGQFFRNGSGGSGGSGSGSKEGGRSSSKIDDIKDDLVLNFPSGESTFFSELNYLQILKN